MHPFIELTEFSAVPTPLSVNVNHISGVVSDAYGSRVYTTGKDFSVTETREQIIEKIDDFYKSRQ